MLRSVFLHSLSSRRRSLVGWGIGMAVLSVYVMALYPSVHGSAAQIEQYLEQMPSGVRQAFMGEMAVSDYSSPAGFLQTEVYSIMAPLLFLFFAIAHGSKAVAGDEENGELELVLATPVSRRTLVLGEFGALVVGAAILGAVLWSGITLMSLVVGASIDAWGSFQATVSACLLGVLYGAIALAAGCVRGRRGVAISVASALAIAAYLFNTFALVVEAMQRFRVLSPFQWYQGGFLVRDGLQLTRAATLVVATAAVVIASTIAIERRDIGT